jgi:hypothetical protein
MSNTRQITVSSVVDAFGGTGAFAARFGLLPSRVSNWRRTNTFPDSLLLFRDIKSACEAEGHPFNERLFSRSAA